MFIAMDGGSASSTRAAPSTANTKPATSTPDTSPSKAWTDAVAQAKANSPQQSVTVKPGDSLTSIANGYHMSLQALEEANPQIICENLLQPGELVYLPKTTPAEVVTGVANSQIKPIITAMANANGDDQGLQELEHAHVHNRFALQELQTESAQDWNTVQQTTYDMLMNNNAGPYPEQAAAAEVKQLNALEPGNAKFAAANTAALAAATQQWTQMGVTKSQLSPIMDAYNNYKQTVNAANQYLANPHLPHNHAIVADLMDSERQAQDQLNAAIEKSLNDAANQAGSDPKARSEAMTERALKIQLAGPQDPAFQTAVDNANYDLQVTKPAEAVAAAYAKGGAQAAADELKTVTENAGNSYYAGQIIQASQGTIDSITKDMGALAGNAPMPNRASFVQPSTTATEFNQIYTDLSQSVEAANTITISGSGGTTQVTLSAGGKTAADIVANSIAQNAPKNLRPWQSALYDNAAENAIASGNGAALTLATAGALKQQGNFDLASSLVESAATGIQSLQSQTKSDVTAFATTTDSLHQLRATWGPFMTGSQLVNATNGYLADHPDVRKTADAQLATISQDGNAVAAAEAAWHSYGASLNGISGRNDLSSAAKSLTGNDASTAFAVSQSTTLNNAIAAALAPSMPSGGKGQSVVQALAASPVWSLPRSTRSFVNALFKTINARAKGSGSSTPYAQGMFTTLSAVGLVLTAENAAAKGFPVSSLQNVAASTYTALGFGKYGGEVIAGLAKDGVFDSFAGKFGLSPTALAGLTKTTWFKALGSAYYGAGALANFLQAEDDFQKGDNWGGGFDVAEGVGNFLNAAKPLIPGLVGEVDADGAATLAGEAIAEGVGAAGSGIGVIAVVGTLIYGLVKSSIDQQHFQDDTSKFLQQGLGLNPSLADALAAPSGQSNGASAAAALLAYAKQYHMTPGELLQKLNQEPADKAAQFVNEAANLPTQSNGGYAASLPTDSPSQTGTHKVLRVAPRGGAYEVSLPYQADSLRQLKYWADYLFGKNQLG